MTKAYSALLAVFAVCFALAMALFAGQTGWLPAVAAVPALYGLCGKTMRCRRFTLWLLLGGIVLRVLILLVLHPPIESDFLTLYQAAESLLAGDHSFLDTMYFTLWGYQSVFVAWQALWLALWNDPLCLRLVNAVLSVAIVCFLYRLLRERASEQAARTACVLLTLFPFVLTLHTVLTNQIVSLFFFVIGLWLLACRDCDKLAFWRYPLAGLALQLGNLMRAEGAVLLVAVLAWAVFAVLEDKTRSKQFVLGLLALLFVYAAAGQGADALTRVSGLNPNGLVNGNPLWKFVTGLNPETHGGYSGNDWKLIAPTLDEMHQITDETVRVERELIAARLTEPRSLLRLAADKTDLLWNHDALCWALGHIQNDSALREMLYDALRGFDRGLFGMTVLLALVGLWPHRGKPLPAGALLLYFVPFALFCALLLIEVQPRYAYLAQPFLFMCAAFGLDRIAARKKGKANESDMPVSGHSLL